MRQSYVYNELRDWPTTISCKQCIAMMDAMSSQEGVQGGFEETDSPGGPPWSQDICNPPYASWSLTYDGGANTVGNLTRVVELDGSIVTYGYDALYRMTSEARTGTQAYSITYGYDLAGNITTKDGSAFGTYDDANKMTQIQGVGFAPSPDFDGNQKQIKSNNYPFTSTTLTYDSRNKLVTADTGTPEWAYRYDGFGRRVYRQNDIQTPTSRRHYIYAGDTLIGEIDDGVPTVAYTWGPDGVASRRVLTGTPNSRFYCYGPQGETRNLTDENQAVTSTYFYEAYGKPKGTVPTEQNPFRYGGKFGYYTDNEIQTFQVGARWYSPYLIRWMSRDPIHYRGGDNLSAYVMGNPVKYVDPSGLKPGDPYDSADSAARQAILDIAPLAMKQGWEYAGRIYLRSDNKWSYTAPQTLRSPYLSDPGSCPSGTSGEGVYHTHPNCPDCLPEQLSRGDKTFTHPTGEPVYIGTEAGKILKWVPSYTYGYGDLMELKPWK